MGTKENLSKADAVGGCYIQASQWKRTTKKREAKAQGEGEAWKELDTRQQRGYNEQNEMLEREGRGFFYSAILTLLYHLHFLSVDSFSPM